MGFSDQERAELDALHSNFNKAVAAIRDDRRYSAEGRQAALAKLYRQTSARVTAAAATARQRQEDRTDALRRKLFGSPGSDPSSIISYRDALDRAERASTPAEAQALLDRAMRSGDTALQRAVLDRAFHAAQSDPFGKGRRSEWSAVVDQFRGVSSAQDDDLAELESLTGTGPTALGSSQAATARLFDNTRGHLTPPSELALLSTQAIDALAAAADGSGEPQDPDAWIRAAAGV